MGSCCEDMCDDIPIAVARLLVAITRQFFLCFSLSNCVNNAFTT